MHVYLVYHDTVVGCYNLNVMCLVTEREGRRKRKWGGGGRGGRGGRQREKRERKQEEEE